MMSRRRAGVAPLAALLGLFMGLTDGAAPAAADGPAVLTYDVVVVGAGTGGVAAALQAARMGRRVALLEETDWIGGQLTASGVGTVDGGTAIRASGLYREFLDAARRFYGDREKSLGTCYWSALGVCVNPAVGQALLVGMIEETRARLRPDGTRAVLDLYLRTSVTAVTRSGDVVQGVQIADGTIIEAAIVVDATEYGDLLPLAGARYRVGNGTSDAVDAEACIQDITYAAVIRKYQRGTPPALQVRIPPPGYEDIRPSFVGKLTRDGAPWFVTGPTGKPGIAYPVNVSFHNGYRGLPDLANPDDYAGGDPLDLPAFTKTGVNWFNDYPAVFHQRLKVAYLEDPAARRALACEAKLLTLNFLHYVQQDLGYRDWSVAADEGFDTPYNRDVNACPNIPEGYRELERHFPLRPYVRESRRLIGLRTLTARDIQRRDGLAGPPPIENAVAVGDYPIDLHNCSADETLETALETKADIDRYVDGFFQIPFESFVPETLDGFLVAEKNLSQSRLANGATRLQPSTMLTGQAAGAIAAVAVERGRPPRRLRPFWVQDALVASGALLAPRLFSDVPLDHPFFPYAQLAATRGIVAGVEPTVFGVGEAATRRTMARAVAKGFELSTQDRPPAVPTFADVPTSDPDFPYVEALYRFGVSSGCATSPRRFCPDAPLTRAQVTVFLVKALGLDPASAPPDPYFIDVATTAPYFPHVQLLRQRGLAAGCAAGAFCPEAGVTRGQIAAFVVRAMRLLP